VKKTKSKQATEYAARWFKVKADLKRLKSEVDDIKDFFHSKLGDDEALKCGEFIIVSTPGSQTTIDRTKLTDALGVEAVMKYMKTTSFTRLDVKREAK